MSFLFDMRRYWVEEGPEAGERRISAASAVGVGGVDVVGRVERCVGAVEEERGGRV